MEFVDVLGYIAGLLTTLTFLPQVIKTVKEKSAKDVALNMFLIVATNQVLWVIYGVLKKRPGDYFDQCTDISIIIDDDLPET